MLRLSGGLYLSICTVVIPNPAAINEMAIMKRFITPVSSFRTFIYDDEGLDTLDKVGMVFVTEDENVSYFIQLSEGMLGLHIMYNPDGIDDTEGNTPPFPRDFYLEDDSCHSIRIMNADLIIEMYNEVFPMATPSQGVFQNLCVTATIVSKPSLVYYMDFAGAWHVARGRVRPNSRAVVIYRAIAPGGLGFRCLGIWNASHTQVNVQCFCRGGATLNPDRHRVWNFGPSHNVNEMRFRLKNHNFFTALYDETF